MKIFTKFVILFLLGLTFRNIPLSGLIHEMGHVIGANIDGARVTVRGFEIAQLNPITHNGLYGGYFVESFFYAILIAIGAKRIWFSGFGFGGLLLTILDVPGSYDYVLGFQKSYEYGMTNLIIYMTLWLTVLIGLIIYVGRNACIMYALKMNNMQKGLKEVPRKPMNYLTS